MNILVGSVLLFLGGACVVVGLAVALARPEDGVGAFGAKQITSLVKALTEAVKALAKLPAAAQLVVLGVLLLGAGVWVLDARPI